MKNFGSTVEFTNERNADIMRVFRSLIATVDSVNNDSICRLIADSPSARFWVSERRAAIVISDMKAGRSLSYMTATKQEMFREIYRRYTELRALHPEKTTLKLVSIIVHQPAPKFYLTPRTIGEFIRRIRRGYYKKTTDNSRHSQGK